MAAYATALIEYDSLPGRKTFSLPGHTVLAPKQLVFKRKEAKTATQSANAEVMVVYGTTDSAGDPLPAKVVGGSYFRYPAGGQASDVSAVLTELRAFVASDEFANLVNSLNFPDQ